MPTLDWLTRRDDEQTAGRVPYRLLESVAELSFGDPAAEKMPIHGDNLDALKALLPFYAGRGLSSSRKSAIRSDGACMSSCR